MKTAIKSLEIIKEMYEYFIKKSRDLEPNLMICEKEDFDNVKKSLEVLEIIKEKRVDIYRIQSTNKVGEYNFWKPTTSKRLKKEEFDLLKEELL